ncbi:hypothetical protein CMI37_09165 [Candidatus Pacearchaeota archaeon]|nr:hypothetical protein [Candidatus Pacearchaeota archaeon]|tara:strand:- start:6387 stop:6824 length:438 start_codon:yes stop_codon:yes gene_type:complete
MEMIWDNIKFKIIDWLLRINIKIGRKLTFYHAIYSAEEEISEVVQPKKPSNQGIGERFKNIIIRDQDVLDKRWAECEKCEHLTTGDKLGKTYHKCNECGCFMRYGDKNIKIAVATARCPLNPPKWDKEYNFIKGESVNGTKPIIT